MQRWKGRVLIDLKTDLYLLWTKGLCLPPKFLVETSALSVMVLGAGHFERWLGLMRHESGDPVMALVSSLEEEDTGALARHHARGQHTVCKPGRGSPLEPDGAGPLISDPQPPQP